MTDNFDIGAYFRGLKKQIDEFDANPLQLIRAADKWYKAAILAINAPGENPPLNFNLLTKWLVAWCDHRGSPNPSSLDDILNLVKLRADKGIKPDDAIVALKLANDVYIDDRMKHAIGVIWRIFNLTILMGAPPSAIPDWVKISEASLGTDIPKGTISKWCNAGDVESTGENADRRVNANSLVRKKIKSDRRKL